MPQCRPVINKPTSGNRDSIVIGIDFINHRSTICPTPVSAKTSRINPRLEYCCGFKSKVQSSKISIWFRAGIAKFQVEDSPVEPFSWAFAIMC